jgi:hypothetical protein
MLDYSRASPAATGIRHIRKQGTIEIITLKLTAMIVAVTIVCVDKVDPESFRTSSGR